jgi:hypothetical protein
MTNKFLLSTLVTLALGSAPAFAADASLSAPKQALVPGHGMTVVPTAKAASAITLGSRAVSNNSQTVYGGFELAAQSTVYILVRGNSLGTLGITQSYLDAPHVRIYNAAGADIYSQNGFVGFNGCTATNDGPVVNYYASRGIPVSDFDACVADVFPAGAYTFTVTPSLAGQNSPINSTRTGEVLFEVKLGP